MSTTIIQHPTLPATKQSAHRRRQVQHLQTLLGQGKLCLADFKLCLTFAECEGEPQADDLFAWLVGITEADLTHRRDYLRVQGVIGYVPAEQPGSFVYRVWEPGIATPIRVHSHRSPAQRWIVLEQGCASHLMREDDLFAAEHTRCGIPALDGDRHRLPILNSPPADYHVCQRCTHSRSRFQVSR